ncbi:DNA-directed RNA polymerase subunit alpha [Limihaloglobus sulfuriphilus]|uniref:DNA-directed RNA polymerase subunit alpha n=1 Tax=Limihaloglobus sulfuriphilus TaxID=1851148 RepID=A0A1Q2MH31_9BACT|nr:DNA-directed RNA polymerase subunit alpha C-terminal domain-containing protein [Limihaloglobus sulfuriphilus]AQQ71959.1 DNA-directed RNA polymerase subunit alpha [Limihaloglobus sulfuriphilus]
MTSSFATEIDIFSGDVPDFEQIDKLISSVNSSELNRERFRKDLEANEDSAKNIAMGLGYFVTGDYAAAQEKLSSAAESAQKHYYLGLIYKKQHRYDNAVKEFNKAMKNNADTNRVDLQKVDILRLEGKFKEAREKLGTCRQLQGTADYYHALGCIQNSEGNYEEALATFQKALEADENHVKSMFDMALLIDLRGDEEEAINLYRKIVEMTPANVNALLNLAVLYEDKGEFQKAGDCVNLVNKLHPNHQRAIMYLRDVESSKVMEVDEEREKLKDRRTQILETPITDFELSVRSRNCLRKMNIFTIGDLMRITEAELLSYKNFGETSLTEIRAMLESKGLRLGMHADGSGEELPEPMELDDEVEYDSDLLSKTVDELELSVRARRAVDRLKIRTLGELVSKTEAELLACKNFGITSLTEIKERLMKFGLNLRRIE